jgi:DUF4097 and DUF4098 domain-containing protein YvlB
MKRIFIPLIAGIAVCCACTTVTAQDFKEHISKEYTVKNVSTQTLSIYNVFGDIKVEGYNGDKILLEINKTISAKNHTDVEIGKKEFKLEFSQNSDTIMAYILEPQDSRPHRNYRNNYDWENRRIYYKYELDFTVKVPYGMNLDISTVNDGNISVKDVTGTLRVHNVNGSVAIVNAKGTTDARTINGDVEVSYVTNPPAASSYYTINGAIRVTYQPDLAADLQFKSMNGSYFTDFENVDVLPNTATKSQDTRGNGTVYKLNKNAAVRIGSGGKTFNFETLNGNIYIKKQK